MKEYAKKFYTSREWRITSRLYMSSIHYVCERCGGVAEICHHRKYITPGNINNPDITLNMDNLEGLCMDCHNKEHKRLHKRNTNMPVFDKSGNLIAVKESQEIQEYKQAVQEIEKISSQLTSHCDIETGKRKEEKA